MEEKKEVTKAAEEEMELELDDLEEVTGGSMRNVNIKKTSDITDNMKKNI